MDLMMSRFLTLDKEGGWVNWPRLNTFPAHSVLLTNVNYGCFPCFWRNNIDVLYPSSVKFSQKVKTLKKYLPGAGKIDLLGALKIQDKDKMWAVHNKAFCSSGSHLSISGKSANSTKILSKESFAASFSKEVLVTITLKRHHWKTN